MFLKFPGRDLGGVLAFLRGFRTDAWLALGGLLLSLPAALALASLTLRLAGIHETQGCCQELFGWIIMFICLLATIFKHKILKTFTVVDKGQLNVQTTSYPLPFKFK